MLQSEYSGSTKRIFMNQSVFRRLLPYLKPYVRTIAFGLALLIISIPASNFHPLGWAFIVDEVVGNRRVDMLLPAIAAMFAVQAIGTILGPGFSGEAVPDAVETIVNTYLGLRADNESFLDTCRRVGHQPFKEALYAAA